MLSDAEILYTDCINELMGKWIAESVVFCYFVENTNVGTDEYVNTWRRLLLRSGTLDACSI